MYQTENGGPKLYPKRIDLVRNKEEDGEVKICIIIDNYRTYQKYSIK